MFQNLNLSLEFQVITGDDLKGFQGFLILSLFLQKQGTKLECTSKCEESFHLLKELLTSAPI